jgi:hypothetical protein
MEEDGLVVKVGPVGQLFREPDGFVTAVSEREMCSLRARRC